MQLEDHVLVAVPKGRTDALSHVANQQSVAASQSMAEPVSSHVVLEHHSVVLLSHMKDQSD
jgi:hypothetical protein